jgi:Xaa-Pro aminopeptidase
MLTADGCRRRRARLLDRLRPTEPLVLGDPLNLRYFTGFDVDPFSLGADFGGLLLLQPDGHTTLVHDNRLPRTVETAHVDDRRTVPWYDGKSPGSGPRRMVLRGELERFGGQVHDALAHPSAPDLWRAIAELRRAKDPDEVATLRACMRATEAGHAWARVHVQPGMTELDVYTGIVQACQVAAGRAVVVYGDFAVSPGSARRGGPPTAHVLQIGEMLILDFSVVLNGYRSDFTNTLVVGGSPSADQQRLFDLCREAMAQGEDRLHPGASCLSVYQSVREVFERAGVADHFPHHAGHGLGLSHPEPPYIVERSTEILAEGDVVTLEPGLYIDGTGGLRIEHNYLITATGFERLSNHLLSLT